MAWAHEKAARLDGFADITMSAFAYLSQPAESWEQLDIKSKTEFQRAIFKDGLLFDGEKFGTAKLSLLVEILQASSVQKSQLVQKIGKVWNQLTQEIEHFASVYERSIARAGKAG